MSLTAAAFLAIFAGGLILAFVRHPIFGLVAYMWSFYQNPSTTWWGREVPDLRWSMIAAVGTLLATLLWQQIEANAGQTVVGDRSLPGGPDRAPAPPPPSPAWYSNGAAKILSIYVLWMWLQTLWAVRPEAHLEGCILYTKYLVLFYVLYRLLLDRRFMELFSWSHVIGCFIWGWIAFGTEIHGRMELKLGPGVDDSNLVGAHLATGLAFAGFLFLGSPGWRRWLAFATIPFILNGIILTASRSAMIATMVGGAMAAMLAPRAHRGKMVACALLGVVLLLQLAGNDVFWERMGTIGQTDVGEMDKSAASRVALLTSQWNMVTDYPLGAGHRGNEFLSPRYVPEEYLSETGYRSAHNTVMAVLVDQGFPGLLLFIALVGWAAFRLVKLRLLDWNGLSAPFGTYRASVGAALAVCLTSGQFVNLFKAEVGLWMLVVLAVIDHLSHAELAAKPAMDPVAAPFHNARAPLRPQRPERVVAGSAQALRPLDITPRRPLSRVSR